LEVAAFDERDFDRRTPQLQDRLEAAETSADDDNVVAPAEVHTVATISSAPGQFSVHRRAVTVLH
jgi:hypothetical protein